MSKNYYCITSKRIKLTYYEERVPPNFICKAKNTKNALKKFYKVFDKNEYRALKIYPIDIISFNNNRYNFYLK